MYVDPSLRRLVERTSTRGFRHTDHPRGVRPAVVGSRLDESDRQTTVTSRVERPESVEWDLTSGTKDPRCTPDSGPETWLYGEGLRTPCSDLTGRPRYMLSSTWTKTSKTGTLVPGVRVQSETVTVVLTVPVEPCVIKTKRKLSQGTTRNRGYTLVVHRNTSQNVHTTYSGRADAFGSRIVRG